MTTHKTYKLRVPRPQYDRITEAFQLRKESYFISFDPETDTIVFKVTEAQRDKWTRNYHLETMFLPENIESYTV